jgi:aryl-alcohol dehydrogenase-like predicted oxidoreductase
MISMQRGAQNAHLNYQGARLVKLKVNCAGGSLMTLENNDSHQLCSDYSDRSPSSDRTLASRDQGVSRREFLGMTAATLLAGRLSGSTKPDTKNGIPYRTLGRTGEKVSVIGLGGYHVGKQSDPDESIQIIRTGIDEGINFLDNCWDYNGGESEIRMGKALRDGYRQKAFLMTKIDGRDKSTAATQLDESLRRLQTDRIDLLQFHEVIRETDPGRIFAEGGAMEVVLQAQKAGKVRYIGFTGHKSPDIHLKMLATASKHGFTFDAVQMPLNVMDAHFNSFEQEVLPALTKNGIGVLGMKPMGDHFILGSKTVTALECLYYAMNLPTSVVITGCDSLPILQQALHAARSFHPMDSAQVAALLARTAKAAEAGQFELYKTSHQFDGTVANPQWLG